MMRKTLSLIAVLVSVAIAVLSATATDPGAWTSAFATLPDRPWTGPDYWANPMQDWHVQNGRAECTKAGPNRSLFLLTRELSARPAPFSSAITVSPVSVPPGTAATAWIGFRIAARGRFGDYRDDAVYGKGMDAGLRADGRLFIGERADVRVEDASAIRGLRVELLRSGRGWELQLRAYDDGQRERARTVLPVPDAAALRGGLALVCHDTPCSLNKWVVGGAKIDAHDDRAFGPILFTQYTLSRRVLKLTAQMVPVGPGEAQDVGLAVRDASHAWREVGRSRIDPLARTASLRVPDWDDTRDWPYRVSYRTADREGRPATAVYEGTIRRDPRDNPRLVVAAFTGNNDLGFPHPDVVRHVSAHRPDVLVFTGDQIYEPVGGFGVQRAPLDMAVLDYLRKWYLFGWEYRDLLKDIPSVALPDDHDVYHGNVWGAGGRDANDGPQRLKQDNGGYTMPVDWVNMVQRTQTSHLPDPVDPAPAERGIGVYFTELIWGGVSFAILEDRKWKSAPAIALPGAEIVNGWARNPGWDSSKTGDVPGAELLGPRQMAFLERWADTLTPGVWMKAVVSQTIFANVATLPKGSRADEITTKLPIQPPAGYAPGEAPVQDHDSNGWPQSPRLAALRLMRRAMAIHIAGDQHLGSTIQYGIDTFRDGPYAICVPSVANFWPRRWYPEQEGGHRSPNAPRNTGDYLDGFGNKMTVLAVSNPFTLGVEPVDINDRAPGYGIITFEPGTRRITMANWPRWVDPRKPGAQPYPGWPITITREDNGGR